MSHSCPNLVSTSFLHNPYIPFLKKNYYNNYYSLFIFFTFDINIFSFHNHSEEMDYIEIHNPLINTNNLEFKVLGQCRVIIMLLQKSQLLCTMSFHAIPKPRLGAK